MSMEWFIGGLVITTLPLLWLLFCKHYNILEHKKRANFYNRKPVPNAQGIFLRITLMTLIVIFGYNFLGNSYMLIYITATTILGIVATIDLFYPISSWIRLIIQIVIFGSVVIYGKVEIDIIRIGMTDYNIPTRIGQMGSVLWFIICTNAVNRFDGIEGQSSGVTAIGSLSLRAVVTFVVFPTYINLTPNIIEQLTITQIISLSLWVVSLVYTCIEYKPQGLIRDIGTIIYGFSLAYLALLGGAKMWTLIVVLSLVMFDRLRVVINRIIVMKKNPLHGDYTHLHHRLLANGWTRNEVRRFVWIRSFVMTILMILQWTQSIHKRIIMIMMAVLFFGVMIYLFWIKKLPFEYKIDFKPDEVITLE